MQNNAHDAGHSHRVVDFNEMGFESFKRAIMCSMCHFNFKTNSSHRRLLRGMFVRSDWLEISLRRVADTEHE